MGQKVLVTGGAGFIGSHIVDALVARGNSVRVIDNLLPQAHSGRIPDYFNPDAEYHFADLRDADSVDAALEGVDAVFHQASVVGIAHSFQFIRRYVEGNSVGTAVLLEALVARRDRIRRLVVASSMSVYGEGTYLCPEHGHVYPQPRSTEQLGLRQWEVQCPRCGVLTAPVPANEDRPLHPQSVYAIGKRDHEELSLVVGKAYGIPTVALRYSNIYGPRQSLHNPYTGVVAIFCARLKNGNPPVIFEDGQQLRDFTSVRDAVQANLIALDHDDAPGQVYNVGAGDRVTILEMARMLSDHYGGAIEPIVNGEARSGDTRHYLTDISRLRSLGYAPMVRLREGLADLVRDAEHSSSSDRFDEALSDLRRRGLSR